MWLSMGEFLENVYNFIIYIVNSSSVYGPLLACLLIMLESIIPVLPLFVFITIVFIAYGYVIGFIVSYILKISLLKKCVKFLVLINLC